MNRIQSIKTTLLVFGLIASSAVHSFVGQMAIGLGEMDENIGRINVSFEADVKFESEDMTGNGHMYYQPGKVRDEMSMGSEQTVMIRRLDTNEFYMLMPGMPGSYMEIDPDKGSEDAPNYKLISREVIGKESVNGIPATKYKSVYESDDGKFGGFTWYTDDHIAVKAFLISESKGEKQRFRFELSNLDRGAQDDALFELPPGAKSFNASAMMGMDMEAMQRQAAEAQRQQAPVAQQQEAAQASTASQSSTANESEDDDGFAGEVADEAQQSAQDAVKDETGNAVEQSIRKGFGKLFGR